jgi:hypothetical protein
MTNKINVIFLLGVVKSVEPETTNVHVSGWGKDAVFREQLDGHKVTMDNGSAFVLPSHREPDCLPGDKVYLEFRRSKHEGE